MSKFKVANKCCDQCLFTDNKVVSDDRKDEVIRGCYRKDTHFVCHKSSIAGTDVCCRGFFENETSNLIRIAGRLNMIEFVDVEK